MDKEVAEDFELIQWWFVYDPINPLELIQWWFVYDPINPLCRIDWNKVVEE